MAFKTKKQKKKSKIMYQVDVIDKFTDDQEASELFDTKKEAEKFAKESAKHDAYSIINKVDRETGSFDI